MHFVHPSNDEFYCKVDEGNYEICRKCPTLEEKCETPLENEKCQCDNIRFINGSMIWSMGWNPFWDRISIFLHLHRYDQYDYDKIWNLSH